MFSYLKKLLPSHFRSSVQAFFLRGDNVYCPICQKSFVTFLPFGKIPRPNALCPYCHSYERTRLLWLYLKDKLPNGNILHVAPEPALFRILSKKNNLKYIAIDKFEPGYRYPKGTLYGDITCLNYSDSYFDLVICIHVLEHVSDDRKAIREFYRVLKPGGWGIIGVPVDLELEATAEDPSITAPELRIKLYGQADHVRMYGMDIVDRLRDVGFMVETVDWAQNYDKIQKFRFGLMESDIFFLIRKN